MPNVMAKYSIKFGSCLANQFRDERLKINNEWDKKDIQER